MKLAKIITDSLFLEKELYELKMIYASYPKKIVVTSGGFDPIHVGHLRCIQESALIADSKFGVLIVIVNGDGFLTRKKGKAFMPHAERMEIIAGLKGVDYVFGWDDGSQTVTGALDIIKPDFFTKGGDRSEAAVVPEFALCNDIGCKVIFGVGGKEKAQSSSDLVKNSLEEKKTCDHKEKFNQIVRLAYRQEYEEIVDLCYDEMGIRKGVD